jgi:ornithine cyclodeaminase
VQSELGYSCSLASWQSRQIGEGQWYNDLDFIELGEILTCRAVVDRTPSDITFFDMTGLALQDLTVARMIFERAMIVGAGANIPWPW